MWVVPTAPEDLTEILSEGLRPADVVELAALGRSPQAALMESYEATARQTFTVFVDGKPSAIFGVSELEPGVGIPWMLGTSRLRVARRQLVIEGRRWVEHFSRIYPTMFNYVDSRNTTAIQWLEVVGFEFGGPENDVEFGYVMFRRFSRV